MAQTIETLAMVESIALARSEKQVKARKTLRRVYFTRVSAVIMPGVTRNWCCKTRSEFQRAVSVAMRVGKCVKIDTFYT